VIRGNQPQEGLKERLKTGAHGRGDSLGSAEPEKTGVGNPGVSQEKKKKKKTKTTTLCHWTFTRKALWLKKGELWGPQKPTKMEVDKLNTS